MAYIQQLLRDLFLFFVDVTLVDQENFEGVLGSVLGNLVDPVWHRVERLHALSVAGEDDGVGPSVVRVSDGAVPLLAGSVPLGLIAYDLQFDGLPSDVEGPESLLLKSSRSQRQWS